MVGLKLIRSIYSPVARVTLVGNVKPIPPATFQVFGGCTPSKRETGLPEMFSSSMNSSSVLSSPPFSGG